MKTENEIQEKLSQLKKKLKEAEEFDGKGLFPNLQAGYDFFKLRSQIKILEWVLSE